MSRTSCADPDYAWPETVAAGRRTMLGVPLLREGAVLGTIGLARKRVEPFTERQIELVRTFADQAVIAIENARLLGELQARTRDLEESLEYQTATSDVLKVISRSTFDLQPVLDTLVETAVRLCGADYGAIYQSRGRGLPLTVAVSPDAADARVSGDSCDSNPCPRSRSVTGRVALEAPGQCTSRTSAPTRTTRSPRRRRRAMRTSSGCRCCATGEPIGVIALARKRVEPFTERQIELVRTFADQAVIAIENARLLGELQARTRDLEESLEYQTATSDVLNVISRSTFDVQPVLDAVVEHGRAALRRR